MELSGFTSFQLVSAVDFRRKEIQWKLRIAEDAEDYSTTSVADICFALHVWMNLIRNFLFLLIQEKNLSNLVNN